MHMKKKKEKKKEKRPMETKPRGTNHEVDLNECISETCCQTQGVHRKSQFRIRDDFGLPKEMIYIRIIAIYI